MLNEINQLLVCTCIKSLGVRWQSIVVALATRGCHAPWGEGPECWSYDMVYPCDDVHISPLLEVLTAGMSTNGARNVIISHCYLEAQDKWTLPHYRDYCYSQTSFYYNHSLGKYTQHTILYTLEIPWDQVSRSMVLFMVSNPAIAFNLITLIKIEKWCL